MVSARSSAHLAAFSTSQIDLLDGKPSGETADHMLTTTIFGFDGARSRGCGLEAPRLPSERHDVRVPFALPEYERAFIEFLRDAVDSLARAGSPLLSQIEVVKQSTTVASTIRDRSGVDVELPEREVGFGFMTSLEAVRSADYDEFAGHLYEAAESLGKDMAKSIFEDIGTITEATGNVVDAGGELTFEKLYEVMDGMEWGLTDEGELSVPSVFVNPAMIEQLRALETPETQAAMEELRARKYEEALARRRRRRLS
jgi:hypothetical protein